MKNIPATIPLGYFGDRSTEAQTLYKAFLKDHHFKTLYEPFCGSSAFSLWAMQNKLADNYTLHT